MNIKPTQPPVSTPSIKQPQNTNQAEQATQAEGNQTENQQVEGPNQNDANDVNQVEDTPEGATNEQETGNAMRDGAVNTIKNNLDASDIKGNIEKFEGKPELIMVKKELLEAAADTFGGTDSQTYKAISQRLGSGAYDNLIQNMIDQYEDGGGNLDKLLQNLANGLQTVKEHAESPPDRDTQTMDHC